LSDSDDSKGRAQHCNEQAEEESPVQAEVSEGLAQFEDEQRDPCNRQATKEHKATAS